MFTCIQYMHIVTITKLGVSLNIMRCYSRLQWALFLKKKKKLGAGSDTVLLCSSRVERAGVRVKGHSDRKILCCHVRDSISTPGCSPDLLGNFSCQKPLVTKPATFSVVVVFVFFCHLITSGDSMTPQFQKMLEETLLSVHFSEFVDKMR